MTCGIYAIFSAIDDDCLYVGQSQNVERRRREHVTKLKNRRKSALQAFVDWYHANGADESLLRFELVEICDNADLAKNQAEGRWFDKLQPRFYGKVPSLSERWSHSKATKEAIAISVRKKFGCDCDAGLCLKHTWACDGCNADFTAKRYRRFCSKSCRLNQVSTASKLDKDTLRKLYFDEGLTPTQIGIHYGVTDITVGNLLSQYGLKLRSPAKHFVDMLTWVDKETLVNLYDCERKTLGGVAASLGITTSMVEKLMDHFEISRRGSSEAQKRFTRIDSLRDVLSQVTLRELYFDRELSAKKIGAMYGHTNGQSVTALMLEYGIQPR